MADTSEGWDYCRSCGHHIDWHPDNEDSIMSPDTPDDLCETYFADVQVGPKDAEREVCD